MTVADQQINSEIIASEPSGLDAAVIQRLHTLKKLLAYLKEKKDPHEQIPNVEAIMEVYRSGDLEWYGDGRVTYWSHGYIIGNVRQFDWDEYLKLSEKHKGYKGFWVEGVSSDPFLFSNIKLTPSLVEWARAAATDDGTQ